MTPDCDGQMVGRSDGQTESIMAKTALCIASYMLTRCQKRTRKPCYRKDDRAMRPIYRCPEKFRKSSQTPPATFPEICKGFLFR